MIAAQHSLIAPATSPNEDPTAASATEIAAAVRARRWSATQVLEAHLARIERHNARINAVVTLDVEGARAAARAVDEAVAQGRPLGPLAGVPYTLKDAFQTAGLRTTSGYKPLAGHVPTQDAAAVRRLRAAGAVLVGKTNLPALAADGQTDNPVFGRTANPWDMTRTCGGSSGGSAAAVCAGFAPFDLGSDLVGSIRGPASFCGVFGLKPTEGRVSLRGHIPALPNAAFAARFANTAGPIARSVEDLRLVLQVVAGPDAHSPEVPPVPLGKSQPCRLRDLRLAWFDGAFPLDVEVRDGLSRTVEALARAGAVVERCSPEGFSFEEAWEAACTLGGIQMVESQSWLARQGLRLLGAAMGRSSPAMRGFGRGAGGRARDYLRALDARDRLGCAVDGLLDRYDGWLLPVCPKVAYPHHPTYRPIEVDGRKVDYLLGNGVAYTCPFNATGHPAVAVPFGRAGTVPFGVQLVGRRWHDTELLDVAAAVAGAGPGVEAPPLS